MKTRTIIPQLLALTFAIAALSAPLQAPNATGVYFSTTNPKDYTELKSDGTFVVRQQGQTMSGKYVVHGTALTLVLPDGHALNGTIRGGVMRDNQGVRWIKK